ncbi:MAG TPA: hypothetical protein VHR45_13565 [Thermoanaerobaculia bacterium]|nr:hypothetical protein [Thermoanaerobaculia bacterium]
MRRKRLLRALKIAPFAALGAALVAALFGLVVMGLWNWLTPALFGWKLITFWQALGLVILSRTLFGGSRVGPGWRGHWRHRMMERWEQMTPEEREKLRAGLLSRCGHFEAPAAKPTA